MSYLRNKSFDKLVSQVSGVITQIEGDFVKIQVKNASPGMLHRQEFEDKALIGIGQKINYLTWQRPNGSNYYRITPDLTDSNTPADKYQLLELLDAISHTDL